MPVTDSGARSAGSATAERPEHGDLNPRIWPLTVIVIVGGLIYFPMLILGPIGERIIG